ncbi:hypothetical protein GCM10023405_50340 [Streptomonospora salina]
MCTDVAADPVESDGAGEHVHPPVHLPPDTAASTPVDSRTGVSPRRSRPEFCERVRHCQRGRAAPVGLLLRRPGRRHPVDRGTAEHCRRPR